MKKVIDNVREVSFKDSHYVPIENYYIKRLCWYVRVACDAKDPCTKCDLKRLNECSCACGGADCHSCCKCVHEGDVLIAPGYDRRVYVVVDEGEGGVHHLRSRIATQKDLDRDPKLHRIGPGVYLYRGCWIRNLGYYSPDEREVWEAEAVNDKTLDAAAHGSTLGMCLQELKWSLGQRYSTT